MYSLQHAIERVEPVLDAVLSPVEWRVQEADPRHLRCLSALVTGSDHGRQENNNTKTPRNKTSNQNQNNRKPLHKQKIRQ